MDEILQVLPNETEDECLFRIGEAKKDGLLDLTWTEISNFFNKEFRKDETEYRTESSYRKKFKNYIDAKDMLVKSGFAESQYSDLDEKIRIYTTTEGLSVAEFRELLKYYPIQHLSKLEKALG